jgi:hypothetical protein
LSNSNNGESLNTVPNRPQSSLNRNPLQQLFASEDFAWMLMGGVVLVTLVGGAAGAGKFVNVMFPAGSFVVGMFLFFRFPLLYLGFTWWLWFLTPLVRRLVDYRSTFTDPSPLLLAPIVVTLVCGFTLIRETPRMGRASGLPFLLTLLSIGYALCLGILNPALPKAKVLESLVDMVIPVLFAFHLFVNWQNYPQFRETLKRIFIWGVIVIGIYGVCQFVFCPEWEVLWLQNSDYNSGGQPLPFKLRVWSTLNSAGPFGIVMMAGLLLLLRASGPKQAVGGVFGFASFLLSGHRASWISWLLGALNIAGASSQQRQLRLIITLSFLVLLVAGLASLEQFSDVIGTRFETFLSLEDDGSRLARASEYEEFFLPALTTVVGAGLGGLGHDSAVLSMLLNFGWIGVLVYFAGMLLPIVKLYQSPLARHDDFIVISRAIVVSILIQLPTALPLEGVSGMITWTFLGIGVAGVKYWQAIALSPEYPDPSEQLTNEQDLYP